ncbi:MAG: CRP/FNR family transcriptional regulator [Crocinitomix sp.]|jgi:CRP/FNR family transcriptional regulator
MMRELVLDNYEHIFEPDLLKAIEEFGFLKEVSEGEEIIKIGDTIKYMPLLIEGAIKISRQDDDGDELLLYYLEKGDVCAMTLTCCMGNTVSDIQAVAEMDTKIIMVPVEKMSDWSRDFHSWRAFVFESYNSRFKEMLEAIDNLAFLNMHERVLKYLRDKAIITKDTSLSITHQTVAYDLHTSRVVVSRILKSLERDGKLKLERNKIQLLDF